MVLPGIAARHIRRAASSAHNMRVQYTSGRSKLAPMDHSIAALQKVLPLARMLADSCNTAPSHGICSHSIHTPVLFAQALAAARQLEDIRCASMRSPVHPTRYQPPTLGPITPAGVPLRAIHQRPGCRHQPWVEAAGTRTIRPRPLLLPTPHTLQHRQPLLLLLLLLPCRPLLPYRGWCPTATPVGAATATAPAAAAAALGKLLPLLPLLLPLLLW